MVLRPPPTRLVKYIYVFQGVSGLNGCWQEKSCNLPPDKFLYKPLDIKDKTNANICISKKCIKSNIIEFWVESVHLLVTANKVTIKKVFGKKSSFLKIKNSYGKKVMENVNFKLFRKKKSPDFFSEDLFLCVVCGKKSFLKNSMTLIPMTIFQRTSVNFGPCFWCFYFKTFFRRIPSLSCREVGSS